MAHGLIKWVLKKQTGLNGLEKREEANPWVVCRKVRMDHSRPKVMQAKKVRANGRPINPKDEV